MSMRGSCLCFASWYRSVLLARKKEEKNASHWFLILITRILASNPPAKPHLSDRPHGGRHIQVNNFTVGEIHTSRLVAAHTALGFSLDLRKTAPIAFPITQQDAELRPICRLCALPQFQRKTPLKEKHPSKINTKFLHVISLKILQTEREDLGLLCWLSTKESACQWRRHWFFLLSEKTQHAMEQLGLCPINTEPVLRAPEPQLQWPEHLGPTLSGKPSHHDEKPLPTATRGKLTQRQMRARHSQK